MPSLLSAASEKTHMLDIRLTAALAGKNRLFVSCVYMDFLVAEILLSITSVSLKVSRHETAQQGRLDPGAEGQAHS